MRQKFLTENLETPPPPALLLQTFSVREVNATIMYSPQKISALRQKIFLTENLDTLPSYPNLFGTRNYSNSKGVPMEIFGSVR